MVIQPERNTAKRSNASGPILKYDNESGEQALVEMVSNKKWLQTL